MKFQSLMVILTLIFFEFGCGFVDKFKAASNTDSNSIAVAPTPTASAAPASNSRESSGGDEASLGRNLLAFGAGVNVVAFTSESKDSTNTAVKLIDESGYGEGWKTDDGKNAHQSVTLEFPARTTLEKIVFDTYFLGSNKNAPKDVRVEISDVSATDGFQTILEATLKDYDQKSDTEQGVDNQIFPVTQKITGRFLRLTIKNNFGYDKNIFTKEMLGYGEQEPLPTQANVSGTYQTWGGAIVHLKQEGAAVIGCNEQNDNIYEGTMEGRVFNYRARKADGKAEGIGFYIFSPDGQKINSMSYPYGKESFGGDSTAGKKSDKIGNCKFLPDLDGSGKDVVKDALERNLADTGRATLYGINFDFNSDVIKPESKPTLDKVTTIMKEKSDWKFSIEGHTDNVGGESFNQTLSEKRAASVLKYLSAAGIDVSRLNSKGFGLSKPIAANDSEAGRAQNRRVELVKQ